MVKAYFLNKVFIKCICSYIRPLEALHTYYTGAGAKDILEKEH